MELKPRAIRAESDFSRRSGRRELCVCRWGLGVRPGRDPHSGAEGGSAANPARACGWGARAWGGEGGAPGAGGSGGGTERWESGAQREERTPTARPGARGLGARLGPGAWYRTRRGHVSLPASARSSSAVGGCGGPSPTWGTRPEAQAASLFRGTRGGLGTPRIARERVRAPLPGLAAGGKWGRGPAAGVALGLLPAPRPGNKGWRGRAVAGP